MLLLLLFVVVDIKGITEPTRISRNNSIQAINDLTSGERSLFDNRWFSILRGNCIFKMGP